MAREEPLGQFVHEAAVVHAAFPPVVIEGQVVVAGGLFGFIRRVVLMADRSGGG